MAKRLVSITTHVEIQRTVRDVVVIKRQRRTSEMKRKAYEVIAKELNTVEDMINALLDMPKGYTLHPLGTPCAMAVDHGAECVYLDEEDWIDEEGWCDYADDYDEIEEIEVDKGKLEKYNFYYVWFEDDDTKICEYVFFNSLDKVKEFFNDIPFGNKTYGTAHFVNGMLEPYEVIGTTL